MYGTNELKKGVRIEINNVPYLILETQFVKPGKGNAFTRVKAKNLLNGSVLDKTYKTGGKIPPAHVQEKEMQFLYSDDKDCFFMDKQSYEQISVAKEILGDEQKWLQENISVKVLFYNDSPIEVSFPNFIVEEIVYCEQGIKGDRVSTSTKPATLKTGAQIQVPLFVNQGDKIKIDTRSGTYAERVKGS